MPALGKGRMPSPLPGVTATQPAHEAQGGSCVVMVVARLEQVQLL